MLSLLQYGREQRLLHRQVNWSGREQLKAQRFQLCIVISREAFAVRFLDFLDVANCFHRGFGKCRGKSAEVYFFSAGAKLLLGGGYGVPCSAILFCKLWIALHHHPKRGLLLSLLAHDPWILETG